MMAFKTESEQPILSNDFVKCYSDRLVIHLYYFPYGNKTIKYTDIQSCELLKLRDLGIFKYKTWGMALSSIWWHADLRRITREYCIILDTNHWPKIGLTMHDDDIIDVYKLIREKMDTNQTTKISFEKDAFDSIGKRDGNIFSSTSEKELDYQKSLESNRAKYPN